MKCLTTIKYFATAQYFIANDFVLKSIPTIRKKKKKKSTGQLKCSAEPAEWTILYCLQYEQQSMLSMKKKSADAPLQLWTFTIKHMELST